VLRAALARADAACDALYGWRYNPLYQSGTIAVSALVVLLVTGLYLLVFYRISDPWGSVARVSAQPLAGRWIRSMHRYASDAALVAVAVHALRMFLQRRTWGARALAWLSGALLVFLFFLCGWTGFVMVWDGHALALAAEGARLLDALPLFSEPVSRAFVGERAMPRAFFFLNLFAHIALPIAVGLALWIHVSRVARPTLLPPRPLLGGFVALLFAVALVMPVTAAPQANPLVLGQPLDLDWFYSFWLPASRQAPVALVWGAFLAATGLLVVVPWLTRPAPERRPPPSVVMERFCTGCEQCYEDCPYGAISMVPRTDGRGGWVARVDPALCVSCGICAGSCAPMGVGPAGRTGRDQLAAVRAFIDRERPRGEDVVLVGCDRSALALAAHDAPVFTVPCAGSMHSSVVEFLVRAGAGGVLVVACPPRDCWNREGATWLEQRLFEGREAELKERVDRRRIALVWAGAAEGTVVADGLATLRRRIEALGDRAEAEAPAAIEIDLQCDPPLVSAGEREDR